MDCMPLIKVSFVCLFGCWFVFHLHDRGIISFMVTLQDEDFDFIRALKMEKNVFANLATVNDVNNVLSSPYKY